MLNNREFKVYIFVVLVFIISFIIIIRLIYLQILKHDYYYALSEKQSNKFVEITNNRGIIYDRNGQIVADNKATASLFIYGDKIESPEKFIDILSKSKIEINKSKINSIINKEGFRWIKRGVDILDAYNLKEQYPRVDLVKHDLRFYPNKSSLADIIGFTGIDNQGLYGIEYNLDRILKLQKTKLSFLRDSRGKIIDLSSINKREAKEVYLTIDLKMQRIAEIILGGDMKEFKATGALAAAMDVNTGEILFSAHLPSFDPNKYYKYSRNLWKNNLTQFLFEPGSIFKPVIFSFLVDNGLINEHERIDCENGSYRISGNIFNDVESHGSLNIYDVVVESSNIGMVKLAKRIQPIKLYNYLKLCGFGEKTGIYGLNEESGLVRDLNRWSNLSKYSISIGQEILVTPIQILRFYAAIANGGLLMKPKIIKALEGRKKYLDTEYRRIFSTNTSNIMKSILRNVVLEGTGSNAKLKYLDISGKTGTAQKFNIHNNSYSTKDYIASFVGYFPLINPEYAMIVLYDSPKKSIYGGSTAAVTFRKIAEQIAIYKHLGNKNIVALR